MRARRRLPENRPRCWEGSVLAEVWETEAVPGWGSDPHWARLSFLSEVLEETLVANGGDSEGAPEAITFSPRAGNQPPPLNKWKRGESPGGQYHRAGDGEVVWSLKRGIRMGDNREGRKQDRSYTGREVSVPQTQMSFPGPPLPSRADGRAGWYGHPPFPRPLPSQSLTWLRAQPGPKEGSGRSSSYPPRLSVPSSRAPPAPLVAPPPPDGASLSARGPRTGIK